MTPYWEAVASPRRWHQHDDGTRCVLTNRGRWMREAQGIKDEAECPGLLSNPSEERDG